MARKTENKRDLQQGQMGQSNSGNDMQRNDTGRSSNQGRKMASGGNRDTNNHAKTKGKNNL